MQFTPIDLNTWKRKEYFQHYFTEIPCTYSITVNLDITNIISKKIKIYPALLHALAAAVNNHDEFKTTLDENGNPGIYDIMHPCYTVFNKDTETFTNVWTAYHKDFKVFYANYLNDAGLAANCIKMLAKNDTPPNTFPVSMLPWESFTGFNLNLPKGSSYLLPIFTAGKYFQEGSSYKLPLAVQVHHAVCDGFHVCRLIDEVKAALQKY